MGAAQRGGGRSGGGRSGGGAIGAGLLVIGIGNGLRQDDGVGWHVAEALAARAEADGLAGLTVLAVHQLTPELVEPIAAAGAVVLVDAVIAAAPLRIPGSRGSGTGAAPGLPPLRLEPLRPAGACARAPLSHHAAPAALLALCDALHGRCPPAWRLLIPIAAGATGYGESLSPGAEARRSEALELLAAWARQPAAAGTPAAAPAAGGHA